MAALTSVLPSPAPEPLPGPSGELGPQLTAFFTSAPMLASAAAVNSFSAKAVGHRAPSSRFALSLKPNVAYLVLNFCALWRSEEHTSELQSRENLVCRLLLEKKKLSQRESVDIL